MSFRDEINPAPSFFLLFLGTLTFTPGPLFEQADIGKELMVGALS
jgi:hypothetical protein